jgi:protein phosphatase
MAQEAAGEPLSANLPPLTIMSLGFDRDSVETSIGTIADCAAATHGGPVRVHNEDHCLTLVSEATDSRPRRYLLAVADGVGGHNAGEVASETAIETLRREFEKGGSDRPHKWLGNAIQKANLAVFDHAHSHPSLHNMQTTLTAALIQGDAVAIGHVGDSRA